MSYYSAIFSAFVDCNSDPVGDFVHIDEKEIEMIANIPSLRLRFERGMQPVKRHEVDVDSSDKE